MLKVVAISDTHTKHNKLSLPDGDILIHSGDCSFIGELSEVIPFLDWLALQNYEHTIFVPGNHDWCFERSPELMKDECEKRGIILLNDSGINIKGINFWGSPVQPEFCYWAFNRNQLEIEPHWDMIPEDTNVLITHGPPYGFGDMIPRGERVGCKALKRRLFDLPNLTAHIFGHIHHSYGTHKSTIELKNVLFVNASSCNEYYECINTPITFNLE